MDSKLTIDSLKKKINELTSELALYKAKSGEESKNISKVKELENAENWRYTINSLDDVVIVINPAYRIEDINKRGIELIGRPYEEIIGKNCFHIIYNSGKPCKSCLLCQIPELNSRVTGENQIRLFNRWFSIKSAPVFDGDGKLLRFVDFLRDISSIKELEVKLSNQQKDIKLIQTEIAKRERQLNDSDQRYKSMFSGHNSVMLLIEPEAQEIVDANRAALDFYGYPYNIITSMKINQLNAGTNAEIDRAVVDAVKQNKKYFDVVHKLSSGELRNVQIYSGPVKIKGKKYLYSIVHDVTKQKQAETALKQSEERFRQLVEHAPDAIFVQTDSKFAYVNQAFLKLYKCGETSQLIGHSVFDRFPVEMHELAKQRIKQLNELKDVVPPMEQRHLTMDNKFIDVEVSGAPVVFEQLQGALVFVRDISARKEAERRIKEQNEEIAAQNEEYATLIEELRQRNEEYQSLNEELTKINQLLAESEKSIRESEERYRNTLDNMIEGCQVIDREWRYAYVNESAARHGRKTKEELLGKKMTEVYPGIDKAPMFRKLERCMFENIPVSMVNEFKFEDGSTGWFELSARQVPDGILILSNDITLRKKAEDDLTQQDFMLKQQNEEYQVLNEELKESNEFIQNMNKDLLDAKEKAEESDRLKSAFLANMSHEIRTPMNGIIGFSEMLNSEDLPDDKRKTYANIIINSGQRLLGIVNDILDISKIESGQVEMKFEPVDMNALVEEIFLFYRTKTKDKSIKLLKICGLPDSECAIISDKTKVYQVLNNLLSNAVKFTDRGMIEFGYKLENEFLEFYVQDTGIGIPKDMQTRIFERFHQIETGFTKNYGGTGLGLSISLRLVELLGGKIWVDSKLGNGSVFYFTIPYKKVDKADKIEVKTTMVKGTSHSGQTGIILIAEDDEVNYIWLSELLNLRGYSLLHAWNGKEAVDIVLHNLKIKLVLMDLKMPVLNGIDAAKIIKSLRPGLPVIAQTAYAMLSEREMVMKEGFDGYLSKPINTRDLIEIINHHLSKSSLQK